jgi:hypothetical protein
MNSVAAICGVILMVASVRPVQCQNIESETSVAEIESVTADFQQIAVNSELMNRSMKPFQLFSSCPENMPVYKSEEGLMDTMPRFERDGSDSGIFIPKFKQCVPVILPEKNENE